MSDDPGHRSTATPCARRSSTPPCRTCRSTAGRKRVLQLGAADAGHDKVMALRVFPGGAVEAIEFWSQLADRRMLAELERATFPP